MGGSSVSAPTLDPGPAIAAYQKAADVIEKKFPVALDRMGAQLNAGTRAALDSYLQANNLSVPYVQTGEDSLNQLRYFLGMRPVDETQRIDNSIDTLIQQAKAPGLAGMYGLDNTLSSLKNAASKINDIQDPTERARAIAGLKTKLATMADNMAYDRNLAMALEHAGGVRRAGAENEWLSMGTGAKLTDEQRALLELDSFKNTSGISGKIITKDGKRNQDVINYLNAAQKLYDKGTVNKMEGNLFSHVKYGISNNEQLNQMSNANRDMESSLRGILTDIDKYIPMEYQAAPTNDEIYEKLTTQPGYQTAYKQGMQALARTQAAKHSSLSGNALLEAQEYGQNLATQAYQNQLANLGALSGVSMPVVQQSLGQQPAFGQSMMGQFNAYGAASQQSLQDIARSRESAFIRQGDTLWDAQKTQAMMDMQADMFNAQSQGSMFGGLGQIAGTVLGGLF